MECWCVIREERHTNVLVSQGNNLLLLNHLDQRPQALVIFSSVNFLTFMSFDDAFRLYGFIFPDF